jgi:hypothetical protein
VVSPLEALGLALLEAAMKKVDVEMIVRDRVLKERLEIAKSGGSEVAQALAIRHLHSLEKEIISALGNPTWEADQIREIKKR